MDSENLYEVLGVANSATEEEIRRAYYGKAKQYHPDIYNGNGVDFDLIKRAYQELINPLTRASHDKAIGISRDFGQSELVKDFAEYQRFRRESGIKRIFKKLYCSVSNLFKAVVRLFGGSRPSLPEKQPSENIINNKVSFALYTEESFPIGQGEKIVLSSPAKLPELDKCLDLLRNSFQNYSSFKKAVMIEIGLGSLPEERIYLVAIERQIDSVWGMDNIRSIELENYSDDMPGLLMFDAHSDGPFWEAINHYGLEFYPGQNLN